MSESSRPHGLQHPRLPCPSLSPRVSSNSCALSTLCCYQTISSSAALFSFGLPSFPDQGLFQGVHCLLRWPNYWNFGFSISSSSEYSGLISFRIDWLDLLALQGSCKENRFPINNLLITILVSLASYDCLKFRYKIPQ